MSIDLLFAHYQKRPDAKTRSQIVVQLLPYIRYVCSFRFANLRLIDRCYFSFDDAVQSVALRLIEILRVRFDRIPGIAYLKGCVKLEVKKHFHAVRLTSTHLSFDQFVSGSDGDIELIEIAALRLGLAFKQPELEEQEREELVRAAIAQLQDRDRQIVKWLWLEGDCFATVQARLKVSRKALEADVHRIRVRLGRLLCQCR